MNKHQSLTNFSHAYGIVVEWIHNIPNLDAEIRHDPMFESIAYFATRYLEDDFFGSSEKALEELINEFTSLSSEVCFFKDIDMNSTLRRRDYVPRVEFRFTTRPPRGGRSFADWLAIKHEVYVALISKLLERRENSSADIGRFFFDLRGRVPHTNHNCSTYEFHSLLRKCRGNVGIAADSLCLSNNAVRKRLLGFLNSVDCDDVERPKLSSLPKDWPMRMYGIQADTRTRRQQDIEAKKKIENMLRLTETDESGNSVSQGERLFKVRKRYKLNVTDRSQSSSS